MNVHELVAYLTDSPSTVNTVLLVYVLLTRPTLLAKEKSRTSRRNGSAGRAGTTRSKSKIDLP
jgi:hypothetical protein